MTLDKDRIDRLMTFANDWESALRKLKKCAEADNPATVAVLSQAECQAAITAIRDAYRATKRQQGGPS